MPSPATQSTTPVETRSREEPFSRRTIVHDALEARRTAAQASGPDPVLLVVTLGLYALQLRIVGARRVGGV